MVVLHEHPDADAVVGAWFVIRFGEAKFPGISKEAEFLFWSAGTPFPSGKKIIAIDVGGGPFDHHPSQKYVGECAATLVAKDLGFQDRPEFQQILEYIKKNDLQGIRSTMDFADFLRCLNQKYSSEKVVQLGFKILDAKLQYEQKKTNESFKTIDLIEKWLSEKTPNNLATRQIRKYVNGLKNGNKVNFDLMEIVEGGLDRTIIFDFLDAKYQNQKDFFKEAVNDLSKAKVMHVTGQNYLMRVVSGHSDSVNFAKLARNQEWGYNAAIVIQRNSNGRTLIFSNKKLNLETEIQNIAAMIRLEEQLVQKKDWITKSYRTLSTEGTIKEVPNWYFQKENRGGKLLNGSLTAPDIEATKIDFQRVQEIVTTALRLGKNFKWNKWLSELHLF